MAPHAQVDLESLTDTQSIPFPDPLTINDVSAKRAKESKMVAGVAAWSSSDLFKVNKGRGKPAKDWTHLLSTESKSRGSSSLKGAAKYLSKPGIISLGGGLPCPEYFPFQDIAMTVPQVGQFSEQETKDHGKVVHTGKYDASEGQGIFDLSIALNYGQGVGSPQLLRFVTEHTEIVCNPPYKDWQCNLTVGSTNALEQAFRMFCERGDYILSEEYTFASAVETAIPLGCKFLGVPMDEEGLIASEMDKILTNWDVNARSARKPHLLYTVPTGQNPSGATQGAQRRKDLYKVCQKHDVFILEDEPYYFLQMAPYVQGQAHAPQPANNQDFLKQLVPTLLSMDVDGRVMRMDSFSKVVAPGTRTGWITASAQICERFVRHNEVSCQNPSGISQLLLYKLLDETWGHEGYLAWLMHIRQEYTHRRDTILDACEKYLPKEVVTWTPPAAGMFLWLHLDHTKHPHYGQKSVVEIEDEIFLSSVDQGVLCSKGSWFLGDKESEPIKLFFRATFAAASNEKMAEAIERFGGAVRKSFGIEA